MHVTVIAKTPVPGRVKTRLCPPCTPEEAADLAAVAIVETMATIDRALGDREVRRVVLLDGEPPCWLPPHYDVVPQRGGDLAERLAHGYADLGPGFVMGMDTPQAASDVGRAVDVLRSGTDVLGMALDGGYWGIGLATVDDAEFAGIEMSTDHTGSDQLERLRRLGRSVVLLGSARDLDTFDDLVALAESAHRGPTADAARRLVARIDHVAEPGRGGVAPTARGKAARVQTCRADRPS